MSKAYLCASLALWRRRLKWRRARLAVAHRNHDALLSRKWDGLVDEASGMIVTRLTQLTATTPLRRRAFKVAESLVGIMEVGGNNAGRDVLRIIRANGGTGPEAWCGDLVAFCYRQAGSKAVTRSWASVALLGRLAGVKRTRYPLRGDLVRFTFDHVGMFDKDNGDGTIRTIEGNTGRSGAVSDSSTGGDGVYRKTRSKQLVNDYLRVTR